MDRAVLVKLHLVLERLRSHHGNMEHLTNSLLVGLEDLGEENARLSGQLTEEDAKIALMIGEPSFYHMASIEAREKFDGALRVNNELRAELQEFKTFNAQLGRQYDEARGSVIKLNIQLEVAQNEINRLNHQVQEAQRELKGPRTQATKLHQVPTDATLDYTKLWPLFAGTSINGDALPTPPLAAQHVSEQLPTPKATSPDNKRPALVSTPSNAAVFFIPPGVNRTKTTTGPTTDHQDAATLKSRSKGIARGGPRVDESFARIKNNLGLTNKTNGSDPVRASYASNDPRVPTSLRDFSWPQATPIQQVKKPLNPECVPFVPAAVKSRLDSKLSPFSQEFIPAMSKPERSASPSHKRVSRVPLEKKDLNTVNDLNETVTSLNNRSRTASSESRMTTSQGPKPVRATASTAIKPEIGAVGSCSMPRGSLDSPSKTESVTSRVTDHVATTKNANSIPPHLRGLPPKAASPKLEPAATLAIPSTPVTANTPLKDMGIIQAEADTMKAWLDTLEKQVMGQSVLDERSNSRPTSEDRLIDLDVEDTGRSTNADSATGFAPEANVPSNMQESQVALEDKIYDTASSADPYLQHLSRKTTVSALKEKSAELEKEQSNTETSRDHQPAPVHEAGTVVMNEDDFGDNEERDKRVSNFTAQLPATENESNIATDFLTAYNSKLLRVKSKYSKSVKNEKDSSSKGTSIEARYHRDQYLDPDYIAPSIVFTRVLGDLLDLSTRSMIMKETPNSRGRDMKIKLEWKPVVKDGTTIFVL